MSAIFLIYTAAMSCQTRRQTAIKITPHYAGRSGVTARQMIDTHSSCRGPQKRQPAIAIAIGIGMVIATAGAGGAYGSRSVSWPRSFIMPLSLFAGMPNANAPPLCGVHCSDTGIYGLTTELAACNGDLSSFVMKRYDCLPCEATKRCVAREKDTLLDAYRSHLITENGYELLKNARSICHFANAFIC